MKPIFAALLMLLPTAAIAAEDKADQERESRVMAAVQLINDKKPGEAVTMLDAVLADYQNAYAGEKRQIYCARDATEALFYLGASAAAAKKGVAKAPGAITVGPGWCRALWAKGFALIDLERLTDAIPFLERAVAMEPAHSHYLSELGYAYQASKRWEESLDAYRRAESHVNLYDPQFRKQEQTRALRGIGYDLIELQRWDEAEAAYRKALEVDPDDQRPKAELDYIAANRPK